MANFNEEFEKLILAEGGYVKDPDDAGGETYLGISRVNNPNWEGWTIIDKVKKEYGTKGITARLKKDENLTNSAKALYKEKYWDILELDDIPSQGIAHQLFDTCVNCGPTTAIRIAQRVAGTDITGKWNKDIKNKLMEYGRL